MYSSQECSSSNLYYLRGRSLPLRKDLSILVFLLAFEDMTQSHSFHIHVVFYVSYHFLAIFQQVFME